MSYAQCPAYLFIDIVVGQLKANIYLIKNTKQRLSLSHYQRLQAVQSLTVWWARTQKRVST